MTAKPALRQAAKLRFGGRLRRLPCGARSRGPVAQLAARTGVRYAQTVATSQSTKRAARAGHELCAPRRLTGASRPAAAPASRQRLACSTKRHRRCLASGGTRQGRFVRRRGTQHRGRRAYSHASSSDLPRLFERSAQRVASYAARPRGEYRSAVGPQGRPPHHEPLPGAARRDAPTSASLVSAHRAASPCAGSAASALRPVRDPQGTTMRSADSALQWRVPVPASRRASVRSRRRRRAA